MSTRRIVLLLLVGLVMVGCVSTDTGTEAPSPGPTASDATPSTPGATTPAADPTAAAAWEDMAARVEGLAAQGTMQARALDEELSKLSDQDMAVEGWFEACCAGPRDDLLVTLEEISNELDIADELGPVLQKEGDFLGVAREAADHAIWLLEDGIESAGLSDSPEEARESVRLGLPTTFNEQIIGCIEACG